MSQRKREGVVGREAAVVEKRQKKAPNFKKVESKHDKLKEEIKSIKLCPQNPGDHR